MCHSMGAGRAMSGQVLAIRHVRLRTWAALPVVLPNQGCKSEISGCRRGCAGRVDVLSPALVVVLGGPIGAYQDALYPFCATSWR